VQEIRIHEDHSLGRHHLERDTSGELLPGFKRTHRSCGNVFKRRHRHAARDDALKCSGRVQNWRRERDGLGPIVRIVHRDVVNLDVLRCARTLKPPGPAKVPAAK
jgi:hypothetical protein